jgi:hypothetical protein
MAWRCTIEKYHAASGEYWVNVYHLAAETGAAALTAANTLVLNERNIHRTNILFTKFRVDDGVEGTDVYDTVAVNQFGLAVLGSSEIMPLFVVLRVELNTVGGGRPSRKYYRGVLLESDVSGMMVTNTGFLTGVSAGLTAAFPGIVVDPDGQAILNAECSPIVGMRQLRRGSKKKVTP